VVRRVRVWGVTNILTTQYFDAAEEMADRIGVVNHGELIVVEEKKALMKKLGKRQLTLTLQDPLAAVPAELGDWKLALRANGHELQYTFDAAEEQTGVAPLLRRLEQLGINYRDLNTRESSLEEIFVSLVGRGARA
jgi:ABC-2 type transport system ATP-binding protein